MYCTWFCDCGRILPKGAMECAPCAQKRAALEAAIQEAFLREHGPNTLVIGPIISTPLPRIIRQ